MVDLTKVYLSPNEQSQYIQNGIIRQLLESANTVSVALVTGSLTANVTSTTITASTCTSSSSILACPLTADAAASIPTMSYAPTAGQFVITHANNSFSDKNFVFVVVS